MAFSGPVKTVWLDDGLHMQVIEAVSYVDPAGRVWRVPAGFVTDGASIPDELWSLVGSPFTGKYRVAAVFHDAAYATLGVAKDDADRMLRDAALELGCEHWRAEAIYEGVRVGGASSYAEDQRAAAAVT
jgi:hypothetical protein